MHLKQLSRVLVQFSPWTGTARSAREFLARVSSVPAQKSNPECKVESKVRVKGDPFVEVTYENQQVARIYTADLNVEQIVEQLRTKIEEMDTATKLKAAGIHGQVLESKWGESLGKERELGEAQFVPRDANM